MNNWMDIYEERNYGSMPYRLLRPIDIADHPDKAYPLIFSLHGAGGKGTDNIKNLRHWNESPLADETHRRKYPCFVLAPQTPLRWLVPNSMPEITREYIDSLSDIWQARVKRLLARGDDLSKSVIWAEPLICWTRYAMSFQLIRTASMCWGIQWVVLVHGTLSVSNPTVSLPRFPLLADANRGMTSAALQKFPSGHFTAMPMQLCPLT